MAALLEMLNCGAFAADEVGICRETRLLIVRLLTDGPETSDRTEFPLRVQSGSVASFVARAVLRDCYM